MMRRLACAGCLLALLNAPLAFATAPPRWFFWVAKPERHGSRKMPGDFTPIYTTYRYHSRERHGLFGYLRWHERPGIARHHSRAHAHEQRPAGRKSHLTL